MGLTDLRRFPPVLSKGIFPAVLLGSAALRLINLGAQSLWFDETYTAHVAAQAPDRMMQFIITDGVHPPLYYWFMAVWIRLFGNSPWSLRIPSAIGGVLTVLVVYLLVKRMAGKFEAVLAAVLTGVSPFLVWHSQDARMYSMECLAAVTAVFFFWNFLERGTIKGFIGLILSHAALFGLQYFGVFLLFVESLFLILFWRKHLHRLIPFLLAQTLAVLPLIYWGSVLLQRTNGAFGIGWIPKPGWADPILTLLNFFVANGGLWNVPAILGGIVLTVLLGLSLRAGDRKEAVWLGILWLVVPLGMAWILSQSLPIYMDRYLILSLPAAVLLASIGAGSLRGWSRYLLPAVLLGAMVPGIWNMNVPTPEFQKEQWREAAEWIRERFQPGGDLIMRVWQEAVPLNYYGLLDRKWEAIETNQVLNLPDLGKDSSVWYVVVWLPSQSAHTFGTAVPEGYSEMNPSVRQWIEQRRSRVTTEEYFAGIVVLILQPPGD